MNGSTAAWTMAPATAASAALPPRRSTFTIVSVTIAESVLTAAAGRSGTALGPGSTR